MANVLSENFSQISPDIQETNASVEEVMSLSDELNNLSNA